MNRHTNARKEGYPPNGKNVDFLFEKQKLINNLEAIKKTSDSMRLLTQEINKSMQDLESIRNDFRSLKVGVNSIAEKLGLEPIP